jgi:hypothetical protein
VAAEIGSDDVVAVGEPPGEVSEATAEGGDAVQADERREVRVAPLVDVQLQRVSSPLPEGR